MARYTVTIELPHVEAQNALSVADLVQRVLMENGSVSPKVVKVEQE